MGIIAFIIIGFLAGLIARALMPGRQTMGLLATTLLGIAGSFIGGFIGSGVTTGGQIWALHPAGLIFSVIGAFVLLLVVGLVTNRRTRVV